MDNGTLSWAVTIFAAVCGVAAFFMIFAYSIRFAGPLLGKSAYTGIQTAFGYSVSGIALFKGSVGIALAFILPAVAAVTSVLGKESKILSIASAVLFLASGILAFCIPNLLCGNYVGSPTLAAGGTACGILSIAGGITDSLLSF